MALNAYLTLKGQKQGAIKGSVTQKGREGSIAVYAVDHDVLSPRDPATGLPTGRRQHGPLLLTKEVDRASPLLRTAFTGRETITEAVLRFFAPAATGQELNHYTIRLTNATLVSVTLRMENNKTPGAAGLPVFETLAFVYQKIEWTWTDGGLTSSDEWVAPA